MLRFLLFASLVACSIGAATLRRPRLDGRIVGGRPVDIEEFPYQVSLQYLGRHICGSSIICPYWVVTAASCFIEMSTSNVQFRAGSSIRESGGTIQPVALLIAHESSDPYTLDFDVAVARVSIPFNYGPAVHAISLNSTEPLACSFSVVSGWSYLNTGGSLPSQLQAIELYITSRVSCNNNYVAFGGITENMICAGVSGGGKGPCSLDVGGPMVVQGQLVGILSWGNGCALPDYPAVYSNFVTFMSFVTEQTGVQ